MPIYEFNRITQALERVITMEAKDQDEPVQDNDLSGFEKYLLDENQAKQTVGTYMGHMARYRKWYENSYGDWQPVLYRANVLDFISYLRNIRKLQPATINGYIAALTAYNNYALDAKLQTDMVVRDKDRIKVQAETVDPNDLDASEVEQFRQAVLVGGGKRDHALVTILAYAGLRISEAINLEVDDIDLVSYELLVRKGKGDKVRIVYINDKIANAVREYLTERDDSGPYLFPSRQGPRLERTTVNRLCNKYSDKITPHKLRHFFGSQSQNEAGYSIHETAQQLGHSSTRTTLRYSHPDKEALKKKANRL